MAESGTNVSEKRVAALVGIERASELLALGEAEVLAAVDAGTIPAYNIDNQLRFWPDELVACARPKSAQR